MQTLLVITAIAATVYIAAAGALYTFQRKLIYFPDTTYYTPFDAGLPSIQEVFLYTPDGERLIAWWAAATPGQPTILYFHGNAGGLAGRADRIRLFTEAGLGIFMLSYRGYSGSTGRPSERALAADAVLAYDYLRQVRVAPADIIAYGESLGTGVAVQLAASHPVGALVLEAPYTSLLDIGKAIYPFMPVETFMVDRFDSRRRIAKAATPILIMHGTRDTTIPITFGQALFELAPEPKTFAPIDGAGHSDIYQFGALDRLIAFLQAHGLEAKAD
jgi:fermentation-respiration switch protein FrsA (DUF1100 family)